MGSTDFFDDDLRKQQAARRLSIGRADEPLTVNDGPGGEEVPVRPLSDFNLTRMAKHKQDVDETAIQASQELERLRKRQEELEREKREMEEIRRKQEEYERGKQEMVERLSQSLVTIEKNELQAERLAELLGATRKRFKEMLSGMEAINEEVWPDDRFHEELGKALALIEDTRMEYNKSLSKIEAAGGADIKTTGAGQPVVFEDRRMVREQEKSFGYWLKVGLAVTLPLIVVILIVATVAILLQGGYVM